MGVMLHCVNMSCKQQTGHKIIIQRTFEPDPQVMVCVTACLEQILVTTPNGCYSHLEPRDKHF